MTGLMTMLLGNSAATPPNVARDPSSDFWYSTISGGPTRAGMPVNSAAAMRAPAVYACVRLLSETLAALPFSVFQRMENGDARRVPDHPVARLFNAKPNRRQTAYQFKARLMAHLALRGNAYARILPGPDGPVSELLPLHPDRVTPRLQDSGRIVYEVRRKNGVTERLNQEDIFHLRGLVLDDDAVCGLDPVTAAARETVGMALAAQDYGARFLANDATPSGILTHPGHFEHDEDRSNWLARWQAERTGAGRHRTALLDYGIKYEQIAMTNEQAQFLELRKHTDVEIARMFRVQPHKIAILDKATFSNIEAQAIEFVTDTMLPWLVNWEQSILNELVFGGENLFVKFNVAGLLRGDSVARNKAYAIGRNWGWLSANDVRRLEDMNGIGDQGDVYLQPVNMQSPGDPAAGGEGDDDRAKALRLVENKGD